MYCVRYRGKADLQRYNVDDVIQSLAVVHNVKQVSFTSEIDP